LPNWLKTDINSLEVNTNLAPSSKLVYEVYTDYTLWCTCTGSTFQPYDWTYPELYFQIQTAAPLTSVTSTQFSTTYTFLVGVGGTITYPTFTTVPSPTVYSKSEFGLIVDGITLSSNGTTVSSHPWLTYNTT
jgi:hypothetical protein